MVRVMVHEISVSQSNVLWWDVNMAMYMYIGFDEEWMLWQKIIQVICCCAQQKYYTQTQNSQTNKKNAYVFWTPDMTHSFVVFVSLSLPLTSYRHSFLCNCSCTWMNVIIFARQSRLQLEVETNGRSGRSLRIWTDIRKDIRSKKRQQGQNYIAWQLHTSGSTHSLFSNCKHQVCYLILYEGNEYLTIKWLPVPESSLL